MDLLRQAIVDANLKQRAVQRLSKMDIQLIGQPLLVAEVHSGLRAKTGDHAHDGPTQALILLVFIEHRIGRAEHHKQQRQKQLFIPVRSLRHATSPVTHDLLGRKILPSRLGPAALNVRKLWRIPELVLNKTVLQIEL